MNELQKKIQEWGNKTMALYTQIALNPANKALYHVYTQSDLTQVESNPHVMIVGINPGSGCYRDYNSPTVEEFLKGSPSWGQRDTMPYWRNVKSCVNTISDFADNCSQTVVTNLTCFASKKLNQLNQHAMRLSAPMTMELIKILSPDILVILSRNVLSIIESINKESGLLGDIDYENIYDDVYAGAINGKPMVCMPHPSTRLTIEKKYLCQEVARLTATGLTPKQILDACTSEDLIQAIERRKAQKKQRQEEIKQCVRKVVDSLHYAGLQAYEESDKTVRFVYADKLQVTVTSCDKGYLAIRLKDHHSKFDYSKQTWDDMNFHLSVMVDKYKWSKDRAWIATKHFSQFSNNMDSAVQEVLSIYQDLTNN